MRILVSLSEFGAYTNSILRAPRLLTRFGARTLLQTALAQYPKEAVYECFCMDHERDIYESAIRQEREHVRIWSFPSDTYTGIFFGLQRIRDALPEDEEILLLSLEHVSTERADAWIQDARIQSAAASISTYTGFSSNLLTPDECLSIRKTDAWVTHLETLNKSSYTVPDLLRTERLTGNVYFRIGRFLKEALGDVETSGGPITLQALLSAHLGRTRQLRAYTLPSYLSFALPEEYLQYNEFSRFSITPYKQPSASFETTTCLVSLFSAGSQFQANGYSTPKPYLPIGSLPMYCMALQSISRLKELILICDEEDATTYSVASVASTTLQQPVRIETLSGTTMGQAATLERILLKGDIPLDAPLLLAACDVETTYMDISLLDPTFDVILYGISNVSFSTQQTGWIHSYTDGTLASFTFKAPPPSERGALCFTGTVWFRKASLFLEALQQTYLQQSKTNGEYYLGNVLQTLVQSGTRMGVIPSYGTVFRTPLEYEQCHFWKTLFSTPQQGFPPLEATT